MCLLDTIESFLKPAYALVMKIDAERNGLKNAALGNQKKLDTLHQEKIAELTALQLELARSAQVGHSLQERVEHVDQQKTFCEVRVSSQEKKELVNHLTAQLKKRIIHD